MYGCYKSNSPVVSAIRNLHTGHISPYFDVAFGNYFKNAFSVSKVDDEVNDLGERLFMNGCECYVEYGFDKDGVIIYYSPPLEKVWLSVSGKIWTDKPFRNTTLYYKKKVKAVSF